MPKTKEQCEQIKKETKNKIIVAAMSYFARNGFEATKISDLASYIGIGQGTMYQYFASKEELFNEIMKIVNMDKEVKDLKLLLLLPLSPKNKINKLSTIIINSLTDKTDFACKITLNTQMLLKTSLNTKESVFQTELYDLMAKLINAGQKAGQVVKGDPLTLADLYWSIVYLYALKKQFTVDNQMITVETLNRILLKDGTRNE